MDPTDHKITSLLQAWSAGDPKALDELMPMVFEDLRRMARFFFHRESETHTLQATALVSELYFQLRKQRKATWDNRKAFFAFAAEVMRHILVDYTRRRSSQKRGYQVPHVAIDSIAHLIGRESNVDLVLDLQTALEELEALDPLQARVVELRFLLGLKLSEAAEALEVSQPTVKRKWRTAKLWLMQRLSEGVSEDTSTDASIDDGADDLSELDESTER